MMNFKNTHITCFEQHNLIILTELHEAIDTLGKLHHILDGLCDFNGTQLPHDFSGLVEQKKKMQDENKSISDYLLKALSRFNGINLKISHMNT